jgi:lysophospholipase L1-like esterase
LSGPFHRYVAIGDSSTEGLDDPDGVGRYRGWADRFAAHVAGAQREPLLYANLAVRGLKTRAILDTQLEPALAMRPDLATVFSGTNDIIRSRVDLDAVARDIRTMQTALREAGATVLTITMPDLSEVIPGAGRLRGRLERFNADVRASCAATGTLCVDLARHAVASDPRLWSEDRLHANALGHARIAQGLARALALDGFDESWSAPLPPRARPSLGAKLASEVRWTRRYLLPWIARRLTGRSSAQGITAKRPHLTPVPDR